MTVDSPSISTGPTEEASRSTGTHSRSAQLVHLIGKLRLAPYSGIVLLVGFVVYFSIRLPETFPTRATVTSIAGDQSITLVLALGLLVTLAVGQFDLSAAQNLGMSAVVCGTLMTKHGMSPALAVVLTLVVGLVVGLVNAFLVAVIGVESLIATLGMSSVLLALTELLSNYQFVGPVSDGFQSFANREVLGFPIVAGYALLLSLLVWYVLEHTPVGRRAYAVGANPEASRLAGVRTARYVAGSLVATALLATAAGILVTAKIGSVAPTLGPAYLLPSFAACFLATTQIKPGRFNVWGTVVALVLLATGVKGLQLLGGKLWVTDMFNGLALIVAVSAAVLSSKRTPRAAKKRRINETREARQAR